MTPELAAAVDEFIEGWPVILIDGPAGAGKTTLAAEIVAHVAPKSAAVIHMDDLYGGWTGLNDELADYLSEEIEPQIRAGDEIVHRRYDWHSDRFAESVRLPATDVLIIEGVGSGHPVMSDVADLLVWVEADPALCERRWLDRDGPQMNENVATWNDTQTAHFERHRTRQRADVIVSTG